MLEDHGYSNIELAKSYKNNIISRVTKKVKTKITFVQSGEKLNSTCAFKVNPNDYNIKIPSVVKSKIAETVAINIKFDLEKKS